MSNKYADKKNANDLRVCHTVSESFKIKQNVAFTRCCEWLGMKKKNTRKMFAGEGIGDV